MASISAWVDANMLVPGKRGQPSKVEGSIERRFCMTYEKLGSADGDGSVLGLVLLPANAVMTSLLLNNDALSGATSVSLGLYKIDQHDGQTFLDTAKSDGTSGKAVYMSAADISAGKANGSEQNGLAAMDIADLPKKAWELLGYTDPKLVNTKFALCLTLTTAGTAAGTITVRGNYILG